MAIWSLRGLVILRCNKYRLWVLQEAAVVGCNGSSGGHYNIDGCNSGGGYNLGGYTIVACSAIHKQLCWEFGVSHNCVCIISKGPLIYVVTCFLITAKLIGSFIITTITWRLVRLLNNKT